MWEKRVKLSGACPERKLIYFLNFHEIQTGKDHSQNFVRPKMNFYCGYLLYSSNKKNRF